MPCLGARRQWAHTLHPPQCEPFKMRQVHLLNMAIRVSQHRPISGGLAISTCTCRKGKGGVEVSAPVGEEEGQAFVMRGGRSFSNCLQNIYLHRKMVLPLSPGLLRLALWVPLPRKAFLAEVQDKCPQGARNLILQHFCSIDFLPCLKDAVHTAAGP